MNAFVGLDVAQKNTSVCIVNDDGKVVRQGVIETRPELIKEFLETKGYSSVKVGMETGPLSV